MVEVWVTAIGGRRRGPFDTGELVVFMADVAVVGHSLSEFTDGAKSRRFLLNKRECAIAPYLAYQLSVFCKLE